jgi:hypothetical protein
MNDRDDSNPSVLKFGKLVRKAGPEADESQAAEAAEAFKQARAKSREALMLDVKLRDGTIESFDYSLPKRVTYKPDGTLVVKFGEDTIILRGNNLDPVRQALTEGRARSLQEGTQAEHDSTPENAARIEQIEIGEGKKLHARH